MTLLKTILSISIITATTIVLIFVFGEIAVRVKEHVQVPVLPDTVELDARYGWCAKKNYHFSGEKKDAAGVSHHVEIHTDANGFRAFGDVTSTKKKVFCIGDSFTFAKDVSQDEPYYAVLAREAGVEVFAYGADGFSTIQEYLVLDDWLDKIKPDLVILQLCHNDFIGNLPELTRLSALNQCQAPQPVLSETGEIVYVNPGDGPLTHAVAWTHSRFLRFFTFRLDNRHGLPTYENTVEHEIERVGAGYPPFQRAAKVTKRALQLFKKRCECVRLIAFDVDLEQPFHGEFKAISKAIELGLNSQVPESVYGKGQIGNRIFAEDNAHWSPLGHKIAANALASSIW